MAIFTQYLLIAIGITTGLKLAGLTYKTLTFVFGGIGLGIGFGLRDLANNFVTGILLLIERPVKIGDWVTVGIYDGQVSHIGARSITVSTTDHQELIVPNADIFSKNFINWTHSDSIVRVELTIRVNRKDNPLRVKQLINEVLLAIPKILSSPKSEVYFREMAEVLLEFRVEFYVDMNYIYSRSEVRSQFLFALWERFEKEGISSPDTLHEILIHNEKAELSEKIASLEDPNLAG
jgi:potassium efflux system protein